MSTRTHQHQLFTQAGPQTETQQHITLGIVVDTSDPREDGRIRAVCPQWGDSMETPIADLPWTLYMSSFGGKTEVPTRGPGIQKSEGAISYGAWFIPKVGATVAVLCIDGDPMHRMYIGCVYDQSTAHTMPHGRYMYDDHPALEKEGSDPIPYGPYTSMEKLIQPLATNQRRAFGHHDDPNHEYRTRGADYSAAAVSVENLNRSFSSVQDDDTIEKDGWTSTQGYQLSRSDPTAETTVTDKNYDNQVYSITSPGFHAIAMDDRQENCRMRFRTTSGHQIILDDTNERIYIATAEGNNWIELDQNGNIDMYSTNKISIHAARDINLTSDESIRITAKQGVHIKAGTDVKTTAVGNIHVLAGSNLKLTGNSGVDMKSGSNVNIQSGSILSLSGSGSVRSTGGAIHFNSSSAPANGATNADEAELTNRIPQHEPYARGMTKDNNTHDPEFTYDDPLVNRQERGTVYDRSMFWRR